MQFIFTGVALIVAFPIAIKLLLALLSNPLLAVLIVPVGLYVISR